MFDFFRKRKQIVVVTMPGTMEDAALRALQIKVAEDIEAGLPVILESGCTLEVK